MAPAKKTTRPKKKTTPGTEIIWIKVPKAQELCGLSAAEIRGLCSEGAFKCFKYKGLNNKNGDGHWVINRQSLLDYLDDMANSYEPAA